MKHNRSRVAVVALFTVANLVATEPASADQVSSPPHKAVVEQRSEGVMPFDMNRTMHMFEPNPSGGVQMVVSNDGDARQIALIRSHLRKEAQAFARGDFADPASIHGTSMPGLAKLHAGARRIAIRYADSTNGGRITFTTSDPALIAAIHNWFAAQVRDHGAHAMMMDH